MLMTAALQTIPMTEFLRMVTEIGILFLGIYGVFYYLRSTKGALILAAVCFVWAGLGMLGRLWELTVIEHVIDVFGNSLVLVLLIIFQPELRRALAQLGSFTVGQGKMRKELVGEVVTAASDMARRKCGALIVLERRVPLQGFINDGISLDSQLTASMLEAIFYPNAPLHDGAVIVRQGRIAAARVILPLARAEHVARNLGTRHRAALGISEDCDAATVLVSEETGMIELAYRGTLYRNLSERQLETGLSALMMRNEEEEIQKILESLETENEKGGARA